MVARALEIESLFDGGCCGLEAIEAPVKGLWCRRLHPGLIMRQVFTSCGLLCSEALGGIPAEEAAQEVKAGRGGTGVELFERDTFSIWTHRAKETVRI
jgi:hypothetical protein